MNIENERLKIIGMCIESVVVSSSATYYLKGEIPHKVFEGASSSYAPLTEYEDVLALIDTTVFGGGERGMMFTDTGVYYKAIMTPVQYFDYGNLEVFSPFETTYFSERYTELLFRGLNELQQVYEEQDHPILSALADLAGEAISSFAEAISDALDEEVERQDKERENEIMELLDSVQEYCRIILQHIQDMTNEDDERTIEDFLESVYILDALANADVEKMKLMLPEGAEIEDLDNIFVVFDGAIHVYEDIVCKNASRVTDEKPVSLEKSGKRFRNQVTGAQNILKFEKSDDALQRALLKMEEAIMGLESAYLKAMNLTNEVIDLFYNTEEDDE